LRLSCIDIGSNTTRLLVADSDAGRLHLVHQERAFTSLGRELFEHGRIRPAKVGDVVEVVRDQRDCARRLGAERVRAVATAVLRSAANGTELIAAIRDATGLTVEVLSEREEARLAFVGVAGTLIGPPPSELGVVDVGGGSCELVVGEPPNHVQWWASVPLGSGELTRSQLHSDPPTASELDSAREQIADQLNRLAVPHPVAAVAVGGNATSLSRLAGQVLTARALGRALALLTGERSTEIAERFGIDSRRARLLPAGLLILELVAETFKAPLAVGQGGIREGVLLEASAR
jgi:exopolyphosphatase/guanosine-5'-triphosphate,3'-diphosphate pyrophosphatase